MNVDQGLVGALVALLVRGREEDLPGGASYKEALFWQV
jgi:hypothetical protein